jgi:hypothetical protein
VNRIWSVTQTDKTRNKPRRSGMLATLSNTAITNPWNGAEQGTTRRTLTMYRVQFHSQTTGRIRVACLISHRLGKCSFLEMYAANLERTKGASTNTRHESSNEQRLCLTRLCDVPNQCPASCTIVFRRKTAQSRDVRPHFSKTSVKQHMKQARAKGNLLFLRLDPRGTHQGLCQCGPQFRQCR